jgi:flagellar basal body rod protein FlgG
MEAQSTALEVWANNLANASTPGFSAMLPVTGESALSALPGDVAAGSRQAVAAGTEVAAVTPLPETSVLSTGDPTDLAITDDGYFVLDAGGRQVLSRDGAFSVDAAGQLVDGSGALVLDSALRPIRVPAGAQVSVRAGAVWAGGTLVARLAVAHVPNPAALQNLGQGHLATNAISGPATVTAASPTEVMGGALNASGTSAVQAMVGLVEAQTAYELAAKVASQSQTLANLTAEIPT